MTDVLFYAEVEITQKGVVEPRTLEELEDNIFEVIEAFTDEDMLIDEETIIIDDEDGVLILMTEEYDNMKELKEKIMTFLKQTVDKTQFNTKIYFYKSEFIEEVAV